LRPIWSRQDQSQPAIAIVHRGLAKYVLANALDHQPLEQRDPEPAPPRSGLARAGGRPPSRCPLGLRDTGRQPGRLISPLALTRQASACLRVRLQVDVLAAPGGMPLATAAKDATSTIPVLFMIGSDPVDLGLVKSFSRPGGNLTGVAYFNVEVVPKRIELLHKLVPGAKSNCPSRAAGE